MKIIDTHSHINFKAFKDDASKVIENSLAQGMGIINVGTKYETSRGAVELALQYSDSVYAAIGLHPMYAAAEFVKLKTDPDEGEFLIREQSFDKQEYKKLAERGGSKVVAIGEIGLDYYYRPKSAAKLAQFKEKQKKIFIEQLDFAHELGLPLILHCRMAHDDVIEILKARNGHRGVIHCFTGTIEQAQSYIAMGFFIGINGIIFKLHLDEVIKKVPLESMVVETDCPYLTPPMAESLRNEPLFIKHTIQKIADLKNISLEQVCEATTQNAKNLFSV